MPSTSASSSNRQSGNGDSENRPKPLWKKPVIWLGTIVVAAVSAAVTGWLQPIIAEAIEEATENGDPIIVSVERQNSPGVYNWPPDISLPSNVNLEEQELAQLGDLSTEDQVTWLEEQGGIPSGLQSLRVSLQGNRGDQVRVTDILAHTECEEPDRGTLVRTVYGRGAQPPSAVMIFHIKESPEGPFVYEAGSTAPEPFFPHKTITLQENEEEYVVVHLVPGEDVYCHVHLEMIVEEDGEQYRQRIPEGNESIPVMSWQSDFQEQQYSRVLYGGEVCYEYHEAPPRTPETYTDTAFLCGNSENFKSGF